MKASKLEMLTALTDIDPKYLKDFHRFLRPEPKWRIIMKKSAKWTGKIIGTAAAAVIVLGLIFLSVWQNSTPLRSAAPTEEDPLCICIDTGFYGENYSFSSVKNGAYYLKQSLTERGLNVEMEIIPESGEERETTLQRIRTEIMSGEGPDVFLCTCINTSVIDTTEATLFPFPERAMADGLFLPLDSYLENAQYMEMDKMHPVIMEAGKTDKGQMIMPISFTLPITAYKEGEAELPPAETTFADVVNSDDPILWSTATYSYRQDNQMYCHFPYLFTELADYKTGELTVLEEDLVQTLKGISTLRNARTSEELPAHFSEQLSFDTYKIQYVGEDLRQGIYDSTPQVILPLYNQKGGATALVNSFAAVNANTQQPENAFLVVDLILSKSMCKSNELYTFFCQNSLPVHMEMGELRDYDPSIGRTSCPYGVKGHGSLEGPAFAAYSKAREQISYTRFYTLLDRELVNLVMSCRGEIQMSDEDGFRSAISKSYEKLQRLLDES